MHISKIVKKAGANSRLQELTSTDKNPNDQSRKGLNAKIGEVKTAIDLTTQESDGLKWEKFDWKNLSESAVKIQDIIQQKDPIALKNAYHSIFSEIIVSEVDKDGKRELKFVLNNEDGTAPRKRDVNLADNIGDDDKMAREETATAAKCQRHFAAAQARVPGRRLATTGTECWSYGALNARRNDVPPTVSHAKNVAT